MRYCAIGPKGCEALASMLKVNASLEYMCLIGSQIGDDGADALIAVVETCALKQLEVQDNLISPKKKMELVDACKRNPSLKVAP